MFLMRNKYILKLKLDNRNLIEVKHKRKYLVQNLEQKNGGITFTPQKIKQNDNAFKEFCVPIGSKVTKAPGGL